IVIRLDVRQLVMLSTPPPDAVSLRLSSASSDSIWRWSESPVLASVEIILRPLRMARAQMPIAAARLLSNTSLGWPCPILGEFPMLASARLFVLVLLAVLVTAEASLAQTVAQTATKWGLLGTWRLDCSTPPSRADGELKYVVRSGKLF